MTVDEHRQWLNSLSLDERIVYDRAFGKAWYAQADPDEAKCRAAGKRAVEMERKT